MWNAGTRNAVCSLPGRAVGCARMWFGEVLETRQIKDNMAAAVEGTDRRVRALLSSFLHTSGKEDESRYVYMEKLTASLFI